MRASQTCGIRVRAPHGFVQGRDLLVEDVALAIKAPVTASQCRGNDGGGQGAITAGETGGDFQQVQRPARIAIGAAGQFEQLGVAGHELLPAKPPSGSRSAVDRWRHQVLVGERLQHIDAGPRQQRIVQGKAGFWWWHR